MTGGEAGPHADVVWQISLGHLVTPRDLTRGCAGGFGKGLGHGVGTVQGPLSEC